MECCTINILGTLLNGIISIPLQVRYAIQNTWGICRTNAKLQQFIFTERIFMNRQPILLVYSESVTELNYQVDS